MNDDQVLDDVGAATIERATSEKISAPRSSEGSRHRVRDFAYRALFLLVLIAIWQAVVSWHLVNPLTASSPRQVAHYLSKSVSDGELLRNFLPTLEATLIAFVAATVVGTIIGIGLGMLPRVERILSPYISAANSMPRIALAPVFIIYFGIGTSSKVALSFSFVVFVFIVNGRAAIKNVSPDIMRMARAFGVGKVGIFLKVLFPTSIPSLFASMRLGLIYSFLGVVTSEMIASKDGLGQLIAYYSGVFDLAAVYGILLVLAVVASVMNYGVGRIETHLLRWQEPLR